MLESIKQITLPEEMCCDEICQVMQAIDGDTDSPKSLFVGGCVRNLLLGVPITDVDIATQFVPEDVIQKLQKAGIKVIPTGIDHGTVTAVVNKKSFEITTLRKDIVTDGRHAKVEFTQDWLQDAKRRDFTLNTLLADISGNIYDPYWAGYRRFKCAPRYFCWRAC